MQLDLDPMDQYLRLFFSYVYGFLSPSKALLLHVLPANLNYSLCVLFLFGALRL